LLAFARICPPAPDVKRFVITQFPYLLDLRFKRRVVSPIVGLLDSLREGSMPPSLAFEIAGLSILLAMFVKRFAITQLH
jgi:hypothetical protein